MQSLVNVVDRSIKDQPKSYFFFLCNSYIIMKKHVSLVDECRVIFLEDFHAHIAVVESRSLY